MKTSSKFLAVLAVLAFAFSPTVLHAQDQPPPPPPDNSGAPPPPDASSGDDSGASFQEFYDQLGSQGQWIQTDNYGYVFQPTVGDPNWAPYTEGHWAYTDAGWTWVSDEPWGWATYHYGRWVNIDGTGWVWVPGYTWAPAWVSWRYGGGYCGWAPLPPATLIGVDFAEPGVNIGIGFYFGSDCDTHYGIGPGCYNFIRVDDIGEPYYRGRYLDRSRNFVVINNTTNITNIHYYSGRPVFGGVNVGGPALADVNAHSRTHIEQVHLVAAGAPGQSTVAGGALNVYAPHINPATVRQAHPPTVTRTLTAVKVNRGTSISHPLAVNASLKPAAPSAAAIQAAKEAQAKAPASAHIATAKTVPKTTLSKPLTSLQPAAEVRRAAPSTAGAPNQPGGQAVPQPNNQALLNEQQNQAKERAAAAAQPEHAQALEQQQAQAKERAAAAAQQEHAQALEQQQAQAKERAAAAAQQEHAQALEQEQAQAKERAAAVQQERAPVVQQRAPVVQEHAAVPQEHAAAPAQHAGPAQGTSEKDKNKDQNASNGGPPAH